MTMWVCYLKSMCIPSFVLIGCYVSELHAHLCPYHNVWPEGGHFLAPPYFDHSYSFVNTDSGLSAYCHGNMYFPNACVYNYGSDAGQPAPSLYTKGLCDT